jgi:hypothetical protein
MLSYKQWKSLNESVLPSFNLGLGRPASLGIVSQFGFEEAGMGKKKHGKKKMEDGEIVKPARKADKPSVDVEVGDDDEDVKSVDVCEKCGGMCGKTSKKKCNLCAMKSKKKMWSDEDDQAEDHEDEDHEDHEDEDHEDEDHEDHEDEDHEDEDHEDGDKPDEAAEDDEEANEAAKHGKKKCNMMDSEDEDEDEDESDEEEEDHEDHEEEEEEDDEEEDHEEHDHEDEEDDKPAFLKKSKKKMHGDSPMMAKKKMLKGHQHKIDMNKNGKIDSEDFELLRKKKEKKKNESAEDAAWWASVRSMIGSPTDKNSDGLFTPLDVDNLYTAVRNESYRSRSVDAVISKHRPALERAKHEGDTQKVKEIQQTLKRLLAQFEYDWSDDQGVKDLMS